MYDSIEMLGEKYGAEEAAAELISEYETTMEQFRSSAEGKETPRVLMLMGLPGSYIECTPNSYAGSLIELAGAENVVQVDTIENFVAWNTEELLALDPDVILLTAHGLPIRPWRCLRRNSPQTISGNISGRFRKIRSISWIMSSSA